MIQLVSKWGVQIIGEEPDLASLCELVLTIVTDDSSFFISRIDEHHILRTKRWNSEPDSDTLKVRAESELKNLIGLFGLYRRTNNLTINAVVEFNDDDSFKDDTLSAHAIIPGAITPLSHDDLRKLINFDNDDIREALFHFSADASWIRVFMTYEALRSYYGGERPFNAKFPVIANELDLVRRTANRHRHAFNARDNLPNPINKGVAINRLRTVFKQVADDLSDNFPRLVNGRDFTIHNYKIDGGNTALGLRISGGNFIED